MIPFMWLQVHGDRRQPNWLDGRFVTDPKTYVRSMLDRAVRMQLPGVLLHAFGGTSGTTGKGYCVEQRELLRNDRLRHVLDYVESGFVQDCTDRKLEPMTYIGSIWERDIQRDDHSFAWPDQEFTDELKGLYTLGFKRIFLDATGHRPELDTFISMTQIPVGAEPIRLKNQQVAACRIPTVTTEKALFGFNNSPNYRVPKGNVDYVVMTRGQATQLRIWRRHKQGFVVCPWSDVEVNMARYMMKLNGALT